MCQLQCWDRRGVSGCLLRCGSWSTATTGQQSTAHHPPVWHACGLWTSHHPQQLLVKVHNPRGSPWADLQEQPESGPSAASLEVYPALARAYRLTLSLQAMLPDPNPEQLHTGNSRQNNLCSRQKGVRVSTAQSKPRCQRDLLLCSAQPQLWVAYSAPISEKETLHLPHHSHSR